MAPDESPFLAPLGEVEQARPGANWKAVGPEAKRRLAPLVKHYMGKAHPFASCVRDQVKHGLSEDHANRRCAVVKDIGSGGTGWRRGSKNVAESTDLLVEEALARLDALEEALTINGVRVLVMEAIRVRPDGRPVYESELAEAIAYGAVEDLVLVEETPGQHRTRAGKWNDLIGRVKGRKRSLADAYDDVKKAGHAGSGRVSEEFAENLHPRDRTGRWARKLAALKPGGKTEIEGVRVERQASGDFTVHHPPTSPRGRNADLPNADPNLASPEVAARSLTSAIGGPGTKAGGRKGAPPVVWPSPRNTKPYEGLSNAELEHIVAGSGTHFHSGLNDRAVARQVLHQRKKRGGGRPKRPGPRARRDRPVVPDFWSEGLPALLRAEELAFWLAPLAEGLPVLRSNKARPGDKDYGQSANPSAFDEKKHPRGGKGKKEGGKFVRKGTTGTDVAHVQRAVGAPTSEGGGATTDAPGAFGFSTFAAVKAFQQKHGLEVDGVVGRQTAAAIAGRKDAKNVAPGALDAGDRKRLRGRPPGRRARRRERRAAGGVLV